MENLHAARVVPSTSSLAAMPFDSGRASFWRFSVTGDAPGRVDDTLLSILSEHRFQEVEIGAPDEVEVGFVAPTHLLDTSFTFEKCGYGPGASVAMFNMRMDTHKPPADLKKAYRLMHEQAAAGASPTGFASKGEKREANENADRQIREELAQGKHRKSKSIPLLWDLKAGVLFCGAGGSTMHEHLQRLMRQAFAVDVQQMSAGIAAGAVLKAEGHSRDYEDLSPSAFTKPPADAVNHTDADADEEEGGYGGDGSTPTVPWVAKSTDLKDFLGNEFLMWVWWQTEQRDEPFDTAAGPVHAAFDKALDMECAWGLAGKQSLRGDGPTRLREAATGLKAGKWPRKLGLLASDGESGFDFTLAGDAYAVSGAKLPEVEEAQSPREIIEARVDSIQTLARIIDGLYGLFLRERTGGGWPATRDRISTWIRERDTDSASRPTATFKPGEADPSIDITMSEPPAPLKIAAG